MSGGAMAGVGAGVGSILFLIGYPGLGIAALASAWGVAAAGQIVGRLLIRTEEERGSPPLREPWIVALLASAILVSAIALAILAVDWPRVSPQIAARLPDAGFGWEAWALAILGLAACAALVSFSPREGDR